MDLLDTGL